MKIFISLFALFLVLGSIYHGKKGDTPEIMNQMVFEKNEVAELTTDQKLILHKEAKKISPYDDSNPTAFGVKRLQALNSILKSRAQAGAITQARFEIENLSNLEKIGEKYLSEELRNRFKEILSTLSEKDSHEKIRKLQDLTEVKVVNEGGYNSLISNYSQAYSPIFSSDFFLGMNSSSATCQNTAPAEPDITGDALTGTDYFSMRADPRFDEFISKLGPLGSEEAILNTFNFVKENVKFIPAFGATQSALQVMRSGTGSAIDRATLLITLFRRMGIPAVYRFGEAFVSEERLKRLFGVEGQIDLFYAVTSSLASYFRDGQGNFQHKNMTIISGSKRLWVLPHAWVRAHINNVWIDLDPSAIDFDYTSLNFDTSYDVIDANLDNWLFGQDASGNYIKKEFFVDKLRKDMEPGIRGKLGQGHDLQDWGLRNIGLRGGVTSTTLPIDEYLSEIDPCIEKQDAFVPEEYQFSSLFRFGPESSPNILVQMPTAQAGENLVYVSHSSGLNTGNVPGQMELRFNDSLLATHSITSGVKIEMFNRIIFPTRYLDYKCQISGNHQAGTVLTFNNNLSNIPFEQVNESIIELKNAQSQGASDTEKMAKFLRIGGRYISFKANSLMHKFDELYDTFHFMPQIAHVSSVNGIILDREDRMLGEIPTGVRVNWRDLVVHYSRHGNKLHPHDYDNVNKFIHSFIMDASAIEHKVIEEIFGFFGASSVKVSQMAAHANAFMGTNYQFLRGDQLGVGNDTAIFNSLTGFPVGLIPLLKLVSNERPLLWGPRSSIDGPNDWRGGGLFVISEKGANVVGAYFGTENFGDLNKGAYQIGKSEDETQDSLFGGNFSSDNYNSFGSICGVSPNPVLVSNGSMYHDFLDFDIKGRTGNTGLQFKRTYLTKLDQPGGSFGDNWIHNWESRLVTPDSVYLNPSASADILYISKNGSQILFSRQPDSTLVPPPGRILKLEEFDDRYELTLKGGVKNIYAKTGAAVPGKLIAIKEPHGEEVSLQYSNGVLVRVVSPLAGELSFTYNSNGLIETVTNERDSLTYSYSYNSDNKLTSVLDFNLYPQSYEYVTDMPGTKAQGLLTKITDALDREINFTYFQNGKVFEEIDHGGAKQTYFYAHFLDTPTTIVKGPNGKTIEYMMDEQLRIVQTKFESGDIQAQKWNADNRVIKYVDELGYESEFGFDSRGNQTGHKKPEDSAFRVTIFNQIFDRPILITPLTGAPTTITLNSSNGDITQLERNDGTGTVSLGFTHDQFGNVLQTTNNFASYANVTNADGQLTTVFDARNPETRTYDSRNRLETRQWASGRVITYTHDDYDRILTISDSHGPDTVNEYEPVGAVGRLIRRTITDGATNQVMEFEWDERDRVTLVRDPLGRETKTTYDVLGVGCTVVDKPRVIEDPAGRKTRMEYDSRNRLVRTVDPRGGVVRREYNARGDMIALTDPEGNRTRFRFDGNSRLIKRERPTIRTVNGKTVASIEITNFFYNEADQLIRKEVELPSLQNGTEKGYLVTELEYDLLNRMSRRVQKKEGPGGIVLETYEDSNFTYERQLDATLMKTANNEVVNLGFSHEATPPFAATGYTVGAAQVGNPLNLIEGTYTVTPAVESPIGSIDKDGINLITRSYDPAGRLTGVDASFAGYTLESTIAHDGFGRKQTVTHSNGLVGTYGHDDLNRISSVGWLGAGENFSEAITYNLQTGNIDQIAREFGTFTYGHDATDQLTSVAYSGTTTLPNELVNRTFNYDFAGNRSTDTANGTTQSARNVITENDKHIFYPDEDGLGRVKQKSSKAEDKHDLFKYRTDGKLIGFKRYENGTLTHDVKYFQDAIGRRVAKKITINGQTWTNVFTYVADLWKILLAADGNGDQRLYVDGSGIDEHLGEISSVGVLAYTTDHLGTVTNGEAVSEKRVVGPYGENLGIDLVGTVSSAPVQYSFTGREYDREKNSTHARNRDLLQNEGVFSTEDPVEGDPHKGRYVKNSPLRYYDPFGLVEEAQGGGL